MNHGPLQRGSDVAAGVLKEFWFGPIQGYGEEKQFPCSSRETIVNVFRLVYS